MNYYNEIDPYAAEWLRNLIQKKQIPNGVIDTRSIRDVQPSDLVGFTQCHFFAGIGGWPLALRLAGWPDDRRVWTGSCPCQPFSITGRRQGSLDERHLWPEMRRLVFDCNPPVCFGEQVESDLGRQWLASVFADLDSNKYAVAGAGLPAAGVGSPQGRPRLFWLAYAVGWRRERSERERQKAKSQGKRQARDSEFVRSMRPAWPPGPDDVNKIPLLANGFPGLVGGCKGYGNAIVPQVGAVFIRAFMEISDLCLS